ncbi:hypothetical protein ABWK22_01735 [Gottfriedia acidiceleris]|uniref:hypothetical protein n=1 Tax=Gottfriedia acidiceleris TaxID=371036 RepID=UPI003394A6EE
MLKVPVLEAKRNLLVQMIVKEHEIDDPGLIHFLKHNVTEDNDLYLHDLFESLMYMWDFYFEQIHVPHQICEEHTEGYGYYIVGAVRIPGLLPYVNHPSFIEFTRGLEIIEKSAYGNLIELVYLPDSLVAANEDPTWSEFAKQPATFMIGMQDNGGLSIHDNIRFLKELRGIAYYIKWLIEGRENI